MVLANDFKKQWLDIRDDATCAFQEFGASGWYVLGNQVEAFEQDLAKLWQMQQAVGVASGLDGLEIALRILGCGPGDRVLTTPLSAFATSLAILKIKAIPVFVDVDEKGGIDLNRCEEALRSRPDIRYFLPVHLFGHPLDPQGLHFIRDRFNVRILEDCAQSIGATRDSRPTGKAGHLAATSFYPTKNLGAFGDGGAILTNDEEFAKQARAFRDYGQTAKYRHELIGYNSRLDELQAALLRRVCLPRLTRWTARRREIADRYLRDIQHPVVTLHREEEAARSSWHLFPLFVAPSHRPNFMRHLQELGISAGIHYPIAIPDQPVMATGAAFEMIGGCDVARRLCATEVSLPIHPYVTDDEISEVINAVNSWEPSF